MLAAAPAPNQPGCSSCREGARRGVARRARDGVGVVAFGVLLALVLVLAAPASVAFGRSSLRTATLTAAITRAMGEAAIPGAIVGVWQRRVPPMSRRSVFATWRRVSR
jgi:hypothetical protein